MPKSESETQIRTSNMFDAFRFQKRLDEIQHARKLAEDDRLLLVVTLVDLGQELEDHPNLSRVGGKI